MNPILTFLIVLGACSLGLGLFIVAVTWAAARLDRAENAASGFQRHEPYTEVTETDSSALRGDFDEQAGLDRLRAEVEAARAADPTAPANLRPIPGQRKESS